jgi:hypothetical protein
VILMVTPTRVYQLIAEGALSPSVTAGRHQFFNRADVEAYAGSREATRAGTTPQSGVGLRVTRAAATINSIDQRLATIERLVERIAARLDIVDEGEPGREGR